MLWRRAKAPVGYYPLISTPNVIHHFVPPFPQMDTPELVERVPEELSEEELRQLYDDEEVDRFLQLFASVSSTSSSSSAILKCFKHVSEVELRVENQAVTRREEPEELDTKFDNEVRSISEKIAFVSEVSA